MVQLLKQNNIFIVPIEPIDQRYTKQWYINLPKLIEEKTDKYNVVTIDGIQTSTGTTQGAFLDFAVTNVYKSSQITEISKLFNDGIVKAGDKFLITDAWNYAVIAIRYMSDLLDIPVEIHSIWHAGAYDPTDILGMKMTKPWPWHFEKSVYHASDWNYFATHFHAKMFLENLSLIRNGSKVFVSGQPHDYLIKPLREFFDKPKEDIIMWPHRYNADKQPEIVEDLAKHINAKFVITQKENLTKEEYYSILGKSKITFSCSLHENLGISQMEGTLTGSIPVVPNRASYSEMYEEEFKYPSLWTQNFEEYLKHKDKLIDFINDRLYNYAKYQTLLSHQADVLSSTYMTANIMIKNLIGEH